MEPFAVLEFTIDRALFLRFFRFHTNKSKFMKFLRWVTYIIAPIGILAGLFNMIFFAGWSGTWIPAVIILALIAGYALDFLLGRYSYSISKKLFEGTQHYQLFNDHFEGESRGLHTSITKTEYLGLHQAYETKDMFYLYLTANQAFIIPKHALALADIERFRDILKGKLDKRFIAA